MGIWTRDISWKWLTVPAGVALLAAAVLWLVGLSNPVPKFRLDPHDADRVIPIQWPWWRRAADFVHRRGYMVLTFDDGPADHSTNAAILRILAAHGAHAIFFTICRKTEENGHAIPARVQDLRADVAAGNLVGDHTYTHVLLTKTKQTDLVHEIVGCQAALRRITGQPIHWFRPPWGRSNAAVMALIKQAGMRQMLWLDDSEDTLLRTPDQIRQHSIMMAGNGGILLMHSRPTTAAVLDDTLTELERMGYRFVLPVTPGAQAR